MPHWQSWAGLRRRPAPGARWAPWRQLDPTQTRRSRSLLILCCDAREKQGVQNAERYLHTQQVRSMKLRLSTALVPCPIVMLVMLVAAALR